MSLWAVVPVKSLDEGKSRLEKIMTQADRRSLNTQLIQHTLKILLNVADIDVVCVISSDAAVLDLADSYGVKTFFERGAGLNEALTQVTQTAINEGIQKLLVLPVDLPLLEQGEVETFLHALNRQPGLVIAADRGRTGTNALLVCPPGSIDYQFGEDSFNLHYQQAQRRNLPVSVCCLPSLEFDIDLPEDYLEVRDLFVAPMGVE